MVEALAVSLATVRRDWEFARSWLFSRMQAHPPTRSLAIDLPLHLSIEVDALYRPLNFKYFTSSALPSDVSSLNNTVVTWEFPVVGKYSFSKDRATFLHPLLEAGPSFRISGNLNDTSPSHYGIAAGAGLEVRALKLKVAPTLRYTHWASDPASSKAAGPPASQNQLELLVSVSF